MKLEELKQVKADFDNGIVVSKGTMLRVLDAAIEGAKLKEQLERQVMQNRPMPQQQNPYVNPAQEYGSVGDLFKRIFG